MSEIFERVPFIETLYNHHRPDFVDTSVRHSGRVETCQKCQYLSAWSDCNHLTIKGVVVNVLFWVGVVVGSYLATSLVIDLIRR